MNGLGRGGMKCGHPQAQVGNGALEAQKCGELWALADAKSFRAATNTSCLCFVTAAGSELNDLNDLIAEKPNQKPKQTKSLKQNQK